MHRESGFTLYELLVTVAVAGIILSFGVPGFMSFIANSRATTHTNDVVTALNLARSEAVRRGAAVTVCSSSDAATCNGGNDWSDGWIARSAAGDVLRVWPARSGGAGVVSGNVDRVQFGPRGSLTSAAPVINIRLDECTGNNGRDVSVNAPGRITVDRVAC
ncbi:MAG TPA: GspH/FimT family pseudopilin [Woeseiaceae bacterium]|nr:GspH/FimT family pseudopilin [Woeseiaceae bacterium]